MSIFIHKDSRVVVQGVTGKEGAFWAKHMKDMGTQVVFGVTPGKEGQDVDGIPVYHSVRRGIKDHPADVAMLVVWLEKLEREASGGDALPVNEAAM